MPLSLATNTTCIVLAGDHLQMKQRVFSSEARELNFDKSIVERLYSYYDTARRRHSGQFSSVPIVQLKHNYRNDAKILRFLSATFYGGSDVLVACSSQPTVPQLSPINFYAAFGNEVCHSHCRHHRYCRRRHHSCSSCGDNVVVVVYVVCYTM